MMVGMFTAVSTAAAEGTTANGSVRAHYLGSNELTSEVTRGEVEEMGIPTRQIWMLVFCAAEIGGE